MKIRTIVAGLLILGTVATAILAAPAGGSFIPTVQRTGQLDQMNTLLMASDGTTAPGLAVASRVQLANAQRFIERELAAVDTTTATAEELAAYVTSVADLYSAIQTLGQTGIQLGLTDLSAQATITKTSLITVLRNQIVLDPRLGEEIRVRAGKTIDDINHDFQPTP